MTEETKKYYSVTTCKQIKENSYLFIMGISKKYHPEYTTTAPNLYIQRFNTTSIEDSLKFIYNYADYVKISNINIVNMDEFKEEYVNNNPNYQIN